MTSLYFYSTVVCLGIVCSFSVLVGATKNVNNDDYSSSKSYFQLLEEVSMSISNNNNAKLKDGSIGEDVYRGVMEVYQPLLKYIALGKQRAREGLKVASSTGDQTHELPKVLQLLREGVSKAASDANKEHITSSPCTHDLLRLVNSLISLNKEVIPFVDAMGKPGPSLTQLSLNFVGNFDQCRAAVMKSEGENPEFNGQYCPITFKSPVPQMTISLGACLPSTCSAHEINNLLTTILTNPGIPSLTNVTRSLLPVHTECRPAKTEVTTATVFAIIVISIVVIMMVLGTVFDLVIVQSTEENKPVLPEQVHTQGTNGHSGYQSINSCGSTDSKDDSTTSNGEVRPLFANATNNSGLAALSSPKGTVLAKVLLAFSVYTNGKKILNSSQQPGSLGAIHGIRFLSMSWVVLGHVYAFVLTFSSNITAMPGFLNQWSFMAIANAFVSVDTFFTLSGLLTSYLTIKEMMKRKTWKINWAMFYFHRIWRLTPPYMLTILIYLGLQQYMGQGPLWANEQPMDKTHCEKNWWTNLLYINNLVNYDGICFGHSWYLANDMQFFVLSPLMLIPFFFNRFLGLASCVVFIVASWITTGVLSTINHWPGTVFGRGLPNLQQDWMSHYYVVPWCRIGPFVVGIVAGYILAVTKGRPFKLPWWAVTLGWIVASASGLSIVYGLYGDVSGKHPSTEGASAFYNAVNRTIWGGCVSWVIIACSAGYGGPVNKLLSWSPFVVLGRLTYMSYLIHFNIIFMYYNSLGALIFLNETTIVVMYLGILLFVNLGSFVAGLALESPMIGLEKALIRKERKD